MVNGKRLPSTVRGWTLLGNPLVQDHRGPPRAECMKHGALWVDEPGVMGAVAAFRKSGRVTTVMLAPNGPSTTLLQRCAKD